MGVTLLKHTHTPQSEPLKSPPRLGLMNTDLLEVNNNDNTAVIFFLAV